MAASSNNIFCPKYEHLNVRREITKTPTRTYRRVYRNIYYPKVINRISSFELFQEQFIYRNKKIFYSTLLISLKFVYPSIGSLEFENERPKRFPKKNVKLRDVNGPKFLIGKREHVRLFTNFALRLFANIRLRGQ